MKCMIIACNANVRREKWRCQLFQVQNVVNMHASALAVKEIEDCLDAKAEP